jgi:1-deoxy-D-xylulose-5-phosphate synthase
MPDKILDSIHNPEDLRKLSVDQLPQLADELRQFIIDIVSENEGHLGSSLGTVELTLALHYVFNTPDDLLVWDVGHQAYGHKILTGRKKIFHTNRRLHGISGFPKRDESEYDPFGTGHSSTAISAVLGMSVASRLAGELERQHIAVVGDASIAAGMAFEALNHAGVTDTNVLVILNDNTIGIDPSVGALKEYLIRKSLGNPENDNLFEALNFDYSGPIDGHDLSLLINELQRLKKISGPKLLHIITKKGKGFAYAEKNQVQYHAPGKFDKVTGKIAPKSLMITTTKFQDVFGETLVELAEQNSKIVGITPAMPTGSSLKLMMERFPERAFDVGIAEQHAVTFAAGMATQGLTVYCNIYSTFMQRAYDQLIHDVCLQKLPVVFCLDRAGLVGEDGATHHGIFDLAYLRAIPHLTIFAPRDEIQLRQMLYTAQLGLKQPLAIRYPRGYGRLEHWKVPFQPISLGIGEVLVEGTKIAVITIGTIINSVKDALEVLKFPPEIGLFDARFVKPLDQNLLHRIFANYSVVVTVEDGVVAGGFGSAVLEFAAQHHYTNEVHLLGIPDVFPEHGRVEELQEICGISSARLQVFLEQLLRKHS